MAEKTGGRVDLLDVVPGGNRQMHGIDRYVDLVTRRGTLRITSPDALLVVVGERNALNYSTQLPDLRQGIHFCLFDNLLGHELLHVVGRRHALPVPGGVDRRGGMFRETVKISAK